MGRGTGDRGGFSALFGARRGPCAGHRLLLGTPEPTPTQWGLLESMSRRAQETGDLVPILSELASCREADWESAPLAQAALGHVTEALRPLGESAWRKPALWASHQMGVREAGNAETLVRRTKAPGTIHVWPEGTQHTHGDMGEGHRTLCGVDFDFSGPESWERSSRGLFTFQAGGAGTSCRRCLAKVRKQEGRFVEAEEESRLMEEQDLLWPEGEAAFADGLARRLREAAASGRLLKATGSGDLAQEAIQAVREAYLEAFEAEVARRPTTIIHRSLEHGRGLREMAKAMSVAQATGSGYVSPHPTSGALARLFSSWLGAEDWRGLVQGTLLTQDEGSSLAVWKVGLRGLIMARAAERGLPGKSPLVLAAGA